LVATAANGIESSGPSLVSPGKDISISLTELKALIAKGLVKPEHLVGTTIAEIMSGKLKPNTTVKLSTLRFGPKDRSNTFTDIVVKIMAGNNPFVFGVDALIALNGSLNTEESEMTFKNINTEALKGGPIESNATKGAGTTATTAAGASTAAVDTGVSLLDYKRVALISENNNMYVPTMVNDKENVNWKFDVKSRKILISEDMVIQLLESGAITKKDFDTEGETIRLKNGTKLPSNVLIIASLQIGDVVLENVKVTVDSTIEEPVMGGMSTTLKKIAALVKGKFLFMKPKEKKGAKPSDD
jgi:hypothetical protein